MLLTDQASYFHYIDQVSVEGEDLIDYYYEPIQIFTGIPIWYTCIFIHKNL